MGRSAFTVPSFSPSLLLAGWVLSEKPFSFFRIWRVIFCTHNSRCLIFFVKNISLLKVVYCFICMVCWEVDSNSFHCSSVVKMCFFPCLLQDFPLLLQSWSLNETCSCLDVFIFIPYGVCWVYHICSLFCLSLILEVSQSLLFYISAILSSWFFWYIMYSWPLKSPVSR